ncbi:MAG: transposase [Deltaproteobacteria bacterium]|nr:transposase [Deltaproteobacteria bacterium]
MKDTVRQTMLLNLGPNFNLPKEKWKIFCLRVQRKLSNEAFLFEISFNEEYEVLVNDTVNKIIARRKQIEEKKLLKPVAKSDVISVNPSAIKVEQIRQVGPERVALNGLDRIGLSKIFHTLGFTTTQANLGMGLVASRMVHPASEWETYRWFNQDSALGELLNIEVTSDKALHEISDIIYNNKDKIEQLICNNLSSIFNAKSIKTYYYLINSYFDTWLNSDEIQPGHSQEKPSDCPLRSLGLVLDNNGFIIRSEIVSGNVSDPNTLEVMLKKLGATKVSQIVMDRDIATASNIQWLREHNYQYIVLNREHEQVFDFSKSLNILSKTNCAIEIYKEITEDQSEASLYCFSQNHDLEESSISLDKAAKFEEELKQIDEGLKNPLCQRDKTKIEMRIDKLFQKYDGISQFYKVIVSDNSLIKSIQEPLLATKITWFNKFFQDNIQKQPATYCIKSNIINLPAEEMWRQYSQLLDIEPVFSIFKADIDFKSLTEKVCTFESHIFITTLAYQCIQIIHKTLQKSGIYTSWESIRLSLASQSTFTVILPTADGVNERVRITSEPEPRQIPIFRALHITRHP